MRFAIRRKGTTDTFLRKDSRMFVWSTSSFTTWSTRNLVPKSDFRFQNEMSVKFGRPSTYIELSEIEVVKITSIEAEVVE